MAHQREATEALTVRRRLLLAYPAGTGKTLTVLSFIHTLALRATLIVVPAPFIHVWTREQEARFPSMRVYAYRGTPKARATILEAYRNDVTGGQKIILLSYEILRSEIKTFQSMRFGAIVLDESGKIRSPLAKVTKAILTLDSPYKIALDGTPISNSIVDLWAVFEWLEKGVLYGNYYKFRSIHGVMHPYIRGKVMSWRDVEGIKARTDHLVIWKDKLDVLPDLPPVQTITVPVTLSSSENALYKSIKDDLLFELNGDTVLIENALTKLLRLRQVTSCAGVLSNEIRECSKFDAVRSLLEQIGTRTVVFTMFEQVALRLRDTLLADGVRVALISGSTGASDREKTLKQFEDGEIDVLIGTTAIERGINLQFCSYMINIDLPWSFAAYDQRVSRLWRKGAQHKVVVYNLECPGTVDVHVRKILENKLSFVQDISNIKQMLCVNPQS